MKALLKLGLVVAAVGAVSATSVHAQVRGIIGAGLSVPVGDFADANGGGAKAGGGTAFLGAEWLPIGRNVGVRVDADFTQFCTTFCDATGGNLDVKHQVLNANLSGILEFPMGTTGNIRPYLLAGAGVYSHKLHGNDVAVGAGDSQTDFGVSGGLGLNFDVGRFGLFAESRFHNVFANGSDLQYIPMTVGVRVGGR
jgi:Outer membrane protein beta-barrel domain